MGHVRQHQAHDDTGPQMHGAIVYPDLPAQWITPCLSSPEITAILFGAVQVAPGLIHECRRLTCETSPLTSGPAHFSTFGGSRGGHLTAVREHLSTMTECKAKLECPLPQSAYRSLHHFRDFHNWRFCSRMTLQFTFVRFCPSALGSVRLLRHLKSPC